MTEGFDYDYAIIGSGLFGSVFAHEAKKLGKRCIVIEKRAHLGGNVYCEEINGIITHKYGAHIFHTNDEKVWSYVNELVPFEPYQHQVKVRIGEEYYSFPFNIKTFKQFWGIEKDQDAVEYFNSQTNESPPYTTLEEKGKAELGEELFNLFIKGYTEKQWGKKCNELPASILSRIPVRLVENEAYFTDKYQGLPRGGYNEIIKKLLEGIECITSTDFFKAKAEWERRAEKIVYTGCIDQLFDYKFGKLEYRSLRFENEWREEQQFQPVSVVNYPDIKVQFTRIIEHKHFHNKNAKGTLITREYPQFYTGQNEPYYPIISEENKRKLQQYQSLINHDKYILGGRLGEYKYYDMHQVIASALAKAKKEFAVTV